MKYIKVHSYVIFCIIENINENQILSYLEYVVFFSKVI